jgi:hypothetical protein
MDTSPELCLSAATVNEAGVAQSDIYIGDPFRNFGVYWNLGIPNFLMHY